MSSYLKVVLKKILRIFGYELNHLNNSKESGVNKIQLVDCPYLENPEYGAMNLKEKMKRVSEGGPFEWPNMIVQNQAVATLVGPARRIIELGGGTGCFAYEAASDPKRCIVCSDFDKDVINWAQENRNRPNIRYIDSLISIKDDKFDLVVAIDVIEHIEDYRSFLKTCASLAPKAIITTPNKNRDNQSAIASPPAFYPHVREWTAGEFYWVMKTFYKSVKLYSMPNIYIPEVIPIQINDNMTPLIAVCEHPHHIS